MVTVRQACLGDALRICELLGQLGYSADLSLVERRLAILGTDPTYAVFVTSVEGVVIGVVSLHVFDLFHQAGRLGRITSMVVDSAMRRTGAGALLIAAADEFFRDAGCLRAEVTSGDHRSGAHTFYESHGYVQDERRFLKRFDAQGEVGKPSQVTVDIQQLNDK